MCSPHLFGCMHFEHGNRHVIDVVRYVVLSAAWISSCLTECHVFVTRLCCSSFLSSLSIFSIQLPTYIFFFIFRTFFSLFIFFGNFVHIRWRIIRITNDGENYDDKTVCKNCSRKKELCVTWKPIWINTIWTFKSLQTQKWNQLVLDYYL